MGNTVVAATCYFVSYSVSYDLGFLVHVVERKKWKEKIIGKEKKGSEKKGDMLRPGVYSTVVAVH